MSAHDDHGPTLDSSSAAPLHAADTASPATTPDAPSQPVARTPDAPSRPEIEVPDAPSRPSDPGGTRSQEAVPEPPEMPSVQDLPREVRTLGQLVEVILASSPTSDAAGLPDAARAALSQLQDLPADMPLGRGPDEYNSEVLQHVLEAHFSGIVLYNALGQTLWMSPHSYRIVGWSDDDRLGRPGWELIHPDDFEKAHNVWVYLLAEPGRDAHFEQRIITKDGTVRMLEVHMKNLLGVPPLDAVVANYHDVTDRNEAFLKVQESEQRQRELAHRDSLTGLLNRRGLESELTSAQARQERGHGTSFSFFFIDLDGFKAINDRLGHPVGDRYLKSVAQRLRDTFGETASIARIGGDEFGVLALGVSTRTAAEDLAHALLARLSEPAQLAPHRIHVPASVGIIAGVQPGVPVEECFRQADAAMYAAKDQGRGRVRVFDSILAQQLEATSALADDMMHCIERDELEVIYQPILRLEDRTVQGVEALIAWNHPSGTQLRAGKFIDIAEETGFVVSLGEFALARVCEDIQRWSDTLEGPLPFVTVNLAPAQLMRSDFLVFVQETLRAYPAAAGLLRVELTERGFFQTEGPWRDKLLRLHQLGVGLVIDDFGTGFSSMRYLAEFPISVLKVDKTYLKRLRDPDEARRDKGRRMLDAICRMCDALGVDVVLEGVETSLQHAEALRSGARFGQGWAYARAASATATLDALRGPTWTL